MNASKPIPQLLDDEPIDHREHGGDHARRDRCAPVLRARRKIGSPVAFPSHSRTTAARVAHLAEPAQTHDDMEKPIEESSATTAETGAMCCSTRRSLYGSLPQECRNSALRLTRVADVPAPVCPVVVVPRESPRSCDGADVVRVQCLDRSTRSRRSMRRNSTSSTGRGRIRIRCTM